MTSSDDLKRQLEELKELLKQAETLFAPVHQVKEEIDGLIFTTNHNFREKVKEIELARDTAIADLQIKQREYTPVYREALSKVNNVRFDIQDTERALEQAITAEEQAAQEQQRLIEQAKAAEAKSQMWEEMAKDAPWRAMAKDHQMSGAKKIVEDRYVIVADGMGLGKTLTSIITCELATKGSVAASEEFPWLGFEKIITVPEQFYEFADGDWVKITGYINYERKEQMRRNHEQYQVVESHEKVTIVDSITRPVGKKILYLCPSSLLSNVLNEWRRWAPHRNATYIGGFPKVVRNTVLDHAMQLDDFVIIVNYEAWRRDWALVEKLNEMKFDTVVIDEAHNAKDRKTSVFKGIEALTVTSPARPEYVLPMTGTPILNRPQELYTLLYLVAPTVFYSENDFLYNYCETYEDANGNPKWKFKAGGLDRIVKAISRHFLRRTKADAGIVLPPKTITLHELQLDKEAYPNQARVREQMRKYATIIIDEAKGKALSAAIKLAIFMRLRQIETWPAGIIQYEMYTDGQGKRQFLRDNLGDKIIKLQVDVEESQKLDYVISYDEADHEWNGLIPEVVTDERVVVFSQFKAPLYELESRINKAGFRAVVFNGETPKPLREEIRKDFDNTYTPRREDSKWDVVLCHYKVGGIGLNLTAATQMVILDEEWNPGKRDQAYDRIHRMGQDKPVTIHVIRNTPTIDDWLAGIVGDKQDMLEDFEAAMQSATDAESILDALKTGLI